MSYTLNSPEQVWALELFIIRLLEEIKESEIVK